MSFDELSDDSKTKIIEHVNNPMLMISVSFSTQRLMYQTEFAYRLNRKKFDADKRCRVEKMRDVMDDLLRKASIFNVNRIDIGATHLRIDDVRKIVYTLGPNVLSLRFVYNQMPMKTLTAGLHKCTALQVLNLAGSHFTEDEFVLFGQMLAKSTLPGTLTKLDLMNNTITNTGMSALAEGLALCFELKSLSLQYNKFTQADMLAQALSHLSKLEKMSFGGLWDDTYTVRGIMQVIVGLENCTALQTLNCMDCGNAGHGIPELTDEAQAMHLQAMRQIVNRTTAFGQLTSLCINALLLVDHAYQLADRLPTMSKLTSLALTACSINDEEIQALCVGLAQCHVIMYVNFENNEISSDGLQSFVTLAAECRTLKSVCVYGN